MPAIAALTGGSKNPKKGKNRQFNASSSETQLSSNGGEQAPKFGGISSTNSDRGSSPLVQTFEIEDMEAGEGADDSTRCSLFPFNLCPCLPPCCDCIPSPFRVIQTATHAFLMLGVSSSTGMLIWSAVKSYQDFQKQLGKLTTEQRVEFTQEIVCIIIVIPCIFYFIGTIRQYDQDLREKRKEVEAKRKELMDDFKGILSSLDDFLGETLRKTLDTAELGFECKQREFARFLEELSHEWGPEMDSPKIMQELRRFCLNWFIVFAECSINPLADPRLIATREELAGCMNLGELYALVIKGSEEAQKYFIMAKKKNDQESVQEHRALFQKLTQSGDFRQKSSRTLIKCCGISWIRIGCCLSSADVYDRLGRDGCYPVVIPFIFGQIVLISGNHIMLIVALFLFIGLICTEIFIGNPRISMLVVLFIVSICIISVLVVFEDLDLVAQLMREIAMLKREKDVVREQNEKMVDDWQDAQVCTDLWIYRTLPRLTLYSEVHGYFELIAIDEFELQMDRINDALELLEHRLPPLPEWKNDGSLDINEKKDFRQVICTISNKRRLEDVVDQLTNQILPWEEEDD